MQIRYTIDYTIQIDNEKPLTIREHLIEEDTDHGRIRATAKGQQHVLRRFGVHDGIIPDRFKIAVHLDDTGPIAITPEGYGPIR